MDGAPSIVLAVVGQVIQRLAAPPDFPDETRQTFRTPQSGKIAASDELQFASDPTSDARGRVKRWDDGQLVIDESVSAPGVLDGQSDGAEILAKWSWSKFNDCLASHGIAAWTVAAIGTACGLACGATLGFGCAACIAAIGGIGAGVVTNCIKRAQS